MRAEEPNSAAMYVTLLLCGLRGGSAMSHQLTLLLSDDEYERLVQEAMQRGSTIEAFAHQRLMEFPEGASTSESRTVQEYLHNQGVIAEVPSGESDTPEEEAEVDRLARLLGAGRTASEMIIEDRGPY